MFNIPTYKLVCVSPHHEKQILGAVWIISHGPKFKIKQLKLR